MVIMGHPKIRLPVSYHPKRRIRKMKKLLLVLVAVMLIAGCTSEFYKHNTLFATNDHVAFSWWGYKNVDAAEAKKSADQGWWGKEIPYIPAK